MRITYMGNNQRGITCLEALAGSSHNIVRAIGQKAEQQGWYKGIEEKARELGIPFSEMNKPNSTENLRRISEDDPEFIVMCGYSKILKPELLNIPPKGTINLHASKLPFYRGAAPLNWALINGEKEIGLSIYFVDEGIDTGPILEQETFPVPINYTIKEVIKRVNELYPPMLLRACDKVEKESFSVIPQDKNKGTYFSRRYPKDGIIEWDKMTAMEVYNKVRALTHPYPGAFFIKGDRKYNVWEAKLEDKNYHGVPGRVVARYSDDWATIIAKDRGIRVKKTEEKK